MVVPYLWAFLWATLPYRGSGEASGKPRETVRRGGGYRGRVESKKPASGLRWGRAKQGSVGGPTDAPGMRCRLSPTADVRSRTSEAAMCRLCCKSLFAPLTANFSGCRRGFRVNMWGTSSPGDKLTGDFGNEPDATSISDRGLFRLLAGNLSPGVFRLLQHNLPGGDISWRSIRSPRRHSPATSVAR